MTDPRAAISCIRRRASRRTRRVFSPSWCACPRTIRPAIARRMRRARRAPRSDSASRSSGIRCPRRVVRANGMVSCVNLIVRERFGRRAVDRLQRARRRRAAGRGLDRRSVRRRSARRPHVRARRRGVEVGFRDLCVRAARAAGRASRRARSSHGAVELHFTYDEEVGGAIGPRVAARAGSSRAGLRDLRRLRLRHHHRAQRLPAPRSRGASASRATPQSRRRASTRSRRRPASSPSCTRLRKTYATMRSRIAGHRLADAGRRADPRRHQHQRRARPRRVPPRSAHHSGGGSGRGRERR